jgi:hypothetical protein
MITQIINVLMGLSAVFLIFSTISSALFDLVEAVWKKRGKLLEQGIREILRKVDGAALDDNALEAAVKTFYESPLINPLFAGNYRKGGRNLPSYIPPERFAAAVLLLADTPNPPAAFAQLKQIAESVVKLALPAGAAPKLEQTEAQLVQHFNDTMDRASGWFGRHARGVLFVIGLLLAVGGNVDTLAIFRTLSTNPDLAEQIADNAGAQFKQQQQDLADQSGTADAATSTDTTQDPASQEVAKQIDLIKQQLGAAQTLGLPLGWGSDDIASFGGFLQKLGSPPKLVGLLITAIALSLGAPFWFNLLNQLGSLRTTLKPPEKKKAEPAPPEAAAESKPAPASGG